MIRRALIAAAAAAVLAGWPAQAQAHATLERTTPARGAVLAHAPAQVSFGFDESVDAALGAVKVFDAHGRPSSRARRSTRAATAPWWPCGCRRACRPARTPRPTGDLGRLASGVGRLHVQRRVAARAAAGEAPRGAHAHEGHGGHAGHEGHTGPSVASLLLGQTAAR